MGKGTPAPSFNSDRLALLGPLVTPRTIELARQRIASPTDRLSEETDDVSLIKVALLLVRLINPDEFLTNQEEGILRGMDRKTFGKLKAAGEI